MLTMNLCGLDYLYIMIDITPTTIYSQNFSIDQFLQSKFKEHTKKNPKTK